MLSPDEVAAGFPRTGREIRAARRRFDEAQIRALKVGDVVLVSGRVFTGRDAVHAYLMKHDPPVDLHGGVLYHCGPVVAKDGRRLAHYRRRPDHQHSRGAVPGGHPRALRRPHRDRQGRDGREDARGAEEVGRGVPERDRRRRAVLRDAASSASTACRSPSSARPKRCGTCRSAISRRSSRWTRTATACTGTSKTASGRILATLAQRATANSQRPTPSSKRNRRTSWVKAEATRNRCDFRPAGPSSSLGSWELAVGS